MTTSPTSPPFAAVRAEVVSDLADGPPDGLDAEEWRIVLHHLAPEVAVHSFGARASESTSLDIGGAEWRRVVSQGAHECFPDLAPARAVHRFNTILARPHVRLAVDAYREAEAVAVGAHRAVLRREALAIVTRQPFVDEASGLSLLDGATQAKMDLAKVAAMRLLAELDGHFFVVREAAADRRSLRAEARQAGAGQREEMEREAKIVDALAAKLQAATP